MLGVPKTYTRHALLLIVDIILIFLSVDLSIYLRITSIPFEKQIGGIIFFTITYILCFYVFDLYSLNQKFRSTYYLTRFLSALFVGTSIVAVTFYLLPSWQVGRGIFFINAVFVAVFLYLWRLLFNRLFIVTIRPRSIVIIGAGTAGETIYEVLIDREEYVIKGFLDDNPANHGMSIGRHQVIGDSSLLFEMFQNKEIEAAVVAITRARNESLFKTIVECKMAGLIVYDMPSLYEELAGKLPVRHLNDIWMAFVTFRGIGGNIYTGKLKRVLDIFISILLLILTLPLIIITAIAIKLDSKGTIFYRQRRMGLGEKIFEIIKFRSMKEDAEVNGAVYASEDDSRVTRIGRIIRMLRIDELPQLYNVFMGDMSFIGPRPERPEFISELKKEIPFYSIRHSVKPGLTGWAQVNFHYAASTHEALEKLQYDLYYIKNVNPFLDFHIMMRTIKVVVFAIGAR